MQHVRSIFATMLAPARRAACATAIVLAACSGSRNRTPSAPPPRAEFLLSSADSTFWVATTSGASRVRGAPLVLARYDGKFFEVYGADDDRSYDDALLVGERLYRRDLITGDSAVVFADTTVPRIASRVRAGSSRRTPARARTKRARPTPRRRQPLRSTFSTSTVHTCRTSITSTSSVPGRAPWHSTRRGVLDLRSGKGVVAADLFGREFGERITAKARLSYQTVRDSILRTRASMRPDERRAADALEQRQFDDRAFTLSDDGRLPIITFSVPGRGVGAVGNAVELEPIDGDSTGWWRSLATTLPLTDDAGNDRVDGNGLSRAGSVRHFRRCRACFDCRLGRSRVAGRGTARAVASHRLARPSGRGRHRAKGAHARVQPGCDVRPRDACRRPVPAPVRRSLEPPARRQSCASSRPFAKAGTKHPS